jgi:hypothetical protein
MGRLYLKRRISNRECRISKLDFIFALKNLVLRAKSEKLNVFIDMFGVYNIYYIVSSIQHGWRRNGLKYQKSKS